MKSLSLTVAMALAGAVSSFAGTSVWSYDKPRGNTMQPAYWYTYEDSTLQTYGKLADTQEGYKEFRATLNMNAPAGKTSATGFGFAWKQTNRRDVPVDLSSYGGICLTYKATNPFRVDFTQSSVTDYNFYGVILPAKDELTPTFIDFRNLAQEAGWGKEVALDLTQQLAVQLNYKDVIARDLEGTGRDRNVITLSAVSLGECETEPPVEEDSLKVLDPYDKTQQVTMKKVDSLKIDLTKVFSAGEGENVTIATTMTAPVLTKVKPVASPGIKDTLVYVPTGIDKDTSVTLIVLAVGSKTVRAQFAVTITNDGEGPICPGDPSCPDDPPPTENHPPKVLSPYDAGTFALDTLPEADTLKIALNKLFSDEDNDKLVFAVDMSANLMRIITPLSSITLNDTLKLVPSGVKKDTNFTVSVSATDGKSDLVQATFVVTIKDQSSAPVAAKIEYETNEDTNLSVPIARGIAANGSDLDGDDFIVIPVDSTKHGKLSQFTQLGSFVYSPELNFHGDDTLTYVLVETANHSVMSEIGTVIIHVKPVNDAPTFAIADSAFLKDTLSLDMNFDEDTVSQIKVPVTSLVFTDIEVVEGTQKLTYRAKGTKIDAALDSVNAQFYFISLKPVLDSSGVALVYLYATDGADSTGVNIPVKLVSPKDVAHAEKDEYTAFNDSVLTVDAKKGVLANDVYPEGITTGMEAELAQKPSHGTLTLNKDGSFTYKAEASFEGVDYFGYYDVINGTKSKPAIVTISVEKRNLAPTVVVKTATLDTTVSEDFPTSRALKYPKSVVSSWFKDPEGDPLTFSAKSKDGKLKVEINDAGTLEVNSAPDSTGKAYVVVTATDKKSGSTSFEFCVNIKPVNDKPMLLHADTIYVSNKSEWKVKWDLDSLVKDVDGDELTYTPNETSALTKYVSLSMKGSVLTVKSIEGVKYKDAQKFAIGVKVSDPDNANVTVPLYVIIGKKPEALRPQFAQPKSTWQNAVMAKHGNVSIMDMQGRMVWKAKLPVNPAEVRNASAQVQGRKILRVNNQTWTIK